MVLICRFIIIGVYEGHRDVPKLYQIIYIRPIKVPRLPLLFRDDLCGIEKDNCLNISIFDIPTNSILETESKLHYLVFWIYIDRG